MKKLIIKILDLLIDLIEEFEDYRYWYHVDVDVGVRKVWKFKLNDKFKAL